LAPPLTFLPGERAGVLEHLVGLLNRGYTPRRWNGVTSVIVEAFNVDNHVNFNNPVGNVASGSFGRPNTANPRPVQLGLRFEF
jgi:hypothetical protein